VREKPFHRAFKHRIAMIELDLRRLPEADEMARLFSVGGANAVSWRAVDHGARSPAIPLRAWAEERFAEAGVSLDGGALKLMTFPRVLGYGFAPISLWQGYGPDGRLRGVIYEVHNTFGETHSYVQAVHLEARRRDYGAERGECSGGWTTSPCVHDVASGCTLRPDDFEMARHNAHIRCRRVDRDQLASVAVVAERSPLAC
jgi:DUF1365 family protein